jgi:hypothetical protein
MGAVVAAASHPSQRAADRLVVLAQGMAAVAPPALQQQAARPLQTVEVGVAVAAHSAASTLLAALVVVVW